MKQKTLLLGLAFAAAIVLSSGGAALGADVSKPPPSGNISLSDNGILLPGGQNASQPEFWGIGEYESWIEQQRAKNQALADSGSKSFYTKDSDGVYVRREWAQKDVDALYSEWQKQLALMKKGYHFTKTISLPDGGLLAGALNPETWPPKSEASPGSTIITLPNGTTLDLGHFNTSREAQKAVDEFLKNQVKQGNLTQKEADTILKHGK